jgi:hypothetical protein
MIPWGAAIDRTTSPGEPAYSRRQEKSAAFYFSVVEIKIHKYAEVA